MIRIHRFIVRLYAILTILITANQCFGITEYEQREATFKKDPDNAYLKYRWAEVASCSTALQLYKELIITENVPDSVRWRAYEASAEYNYLKGEFQKASELFKSASKLSNSPHLKHLWALSLYRIGDNESAQSLWHALALENKADYSLSYNFFSGLMKLKKGDYAGAHSFFSKCKPVNVNRPLSLEALSAEHYCLVQLGQIEQSHQLENEIKKFGDLIPQVDWSSGMSSDLHSSKQSALQSVGEKSNLMQGTFTVQVGAFGSQKNAYTLQKKLSERFRNVTVTTVTIDEKTYYRVRIGTFTTRELAEKFVADSLQNAGVNAKTVPQ